MKARATIACLGLLAIVLTGACGEDDTGATPAPPPVAKPAPKPQAAPPPALAPAPAAPVAPEPPVWSYSPIGKRDPFRSYLADIEKEKGGPEEKLTETEKFELDQYRLTGLVTGTAQPNAMVEDPEGKGHTLRIGSRLGKNGGRVTRITSVGIVVTEEFRAPTGERVRVPIQILLPKPELELSIEP